MPTPKPKAKTTRRTRTPQAAAGSTRGRARGGANPAARKAKAPARTRSEWPSPWMAPFLEAMATVPSISKSAERVQVDRRTVQRAMQRDEKFAVAVEDARQQALDTLEHIMFLRATTGTPARKTVTKTTPTKVKVRGADGRVVEEVVQVVETTVTEELHISDQLAMFYLKAFRPQFGDRVGVELTGKGGGPVRHDVTHKIEGGLSDEDADQLHEILRRAAERAGDDDG